MTISSNFKVFFENKNIYLDEQQEKVTLILSKYLLNQQKTHNIFSFLTKKTNSNGIYLWGNVGCGKTILLDRLFELLPTNKKTKLHFHEFMQYAHSLIFKTRQIGQTENPIIKVAKEIATKYKYIYLDELDIQDITDAMVVGKLFDELLKLKINFLITSNRAPNELYKHGLQRNFFLKFIYILEKNIKVIPILSNTDYRYLNQNNFKSFYSPLTKENVSIMKNQFITAIDHKETIRQNFFIGNRVINCNKTYKKIAWFEFEEIFLQLYSSADYIIFINNFDIIFINAIPAITAEERNIIKRFISFIDLAYNKKTVLILSSSVSLDKIYIKGEDIFEFKRTLSRLTEMQTSLYIGNKL